MLIECVIVDGERKRGHFPTYSDITPRIGEYVRDLSNKIYKIDKVIYCGGSTVELELIPYKELIC
jgi:hypothetical protein